jgi:hypothetical protein
MNCGQAVPRLDFFRCDAEASANDVLVNGIQPSEDHLKELPFFLPDQRPCGILTTVVENSFDSFFTIIALWSTEADDCAWIGQDANDLPLRNAGFFVDFVNILIWLVFDEAVALENSLHQ